MFPEAQHNMDNRGFLLIIFLLGIHCLSIQSQDSTSSGIKPSRLNAFNSLMVSFDYSSNTGSYGIYNTEVNQPSYATAVTFISKFGFDAGGMFFITDNSDQTYTKATTEFDLMLGYQFNIGHFSIYPNYTHFFNNDESNSVKSAYTDNIQLDLSFEYRFFMSALTGNYLFGDENTPALSFQNYLLMDKSNFIFDRLYVALQPGVDLTWSNRYDYQNNVLDYLLNNPRRLKTFLDNHQFLKRRYNRLKSNYPDLTNEQLLTLLTSRYITTNKDFKLSSFSVLLPVYFMYGNFSINLSGMYYKPLNVSKYLDDSAEFYLSAGVAYIFSW